LFHWLIEVSLLISPTSGLHTRMLFIRIVEGMYPARIPTRPLPLSGKRRDRECHIQKNHNWKKILVEGEWRDLTNS